MVTHSVQINSRSYNITRASAVKQKSLMLLMGGRVALNSRAGEIPEIEVPFLKGVLLGMPEAEFDKVVDIVLWKCAEAGADSLVTLDGFQHGMNEFITLVAEAVKFNLADFFGWLDSENQSAINKTAGQ